MSTFFILTAVFFWLLLGYYSLLTVAGIYYRADERKTRPLSAYPSVSVFIPAFNEAAVLADTLHAMTMLIYPGKLDIYVLNDSSQDATAEIAQFYAELFPNIHHLLVPPGTPKGKSRVLNYGLSMTCSDYFAVFDADNQPEPDAVRLLVEQAVQYPGAVGAIGHVKTINHSQNILTRMISLEFEVFQLLMQAGRWKLFSISTLPGTNMVVARKAALEVGGYDSYALAEDADLTLALVARGGLLPFVPESVTWEQEPETFLAWFRQRTRWSQGNIYIVAKSFRTKAWWHRRVFQFIIHHLVIYMGFSLLLILSDIWLILGLLGLASTHYSLPLLLLWFQCYMVYLIQLLSALTFHRRVTPANVFVAIIMYVTYAQLFLVLLVRGVIFYIKQSRSLTGPFWEKTPRF